MESEREKQHPGSRKQPKVVFTKSDLDKLLGTSELTARPSGGGDGIVIQARMSHRQVRDVFVDTGDKYPEIMTYEQAAKMVQVAESTLKGWFSESRYADCVRRGKPGRVIRDAFLKEFMKDDFG